MKRQQENDVDVFSAMIFVALFLSLGWLFVTDTLPKMEKQAKVATYNRLAAYAEATNE